MIASHPHVKVLGRRECCLCEPVRAVVQQAADQGLCTWEPVDVDRDKALLVRYGMDVPVVLVNGTERFRHRLEFGDLQKALGEAVC